MPASNARPLSELRAGDAELFGGKSAILGELLHAGIPVPPGFALAASAFADHVRGAGLQTRIADELARAGESVESLHATAARIGDWIRGAEVPRAIASEVAAHYAELDGDGPPVAVRSSALGEDSAEATFAGQQETILWVRGAGDVADAIRRCWASLYSPEAISYRRRLDDGRGPVPAMGVTVQRMVDAAVAGVMFTCNPVSGDRSMVAINAAWGLGLAVVGGEVTPDDLLVSKVTGELVRETIGAKDVQYVPGPDHRGTERTEVDPARRQARCLDEPALAALVELGHRVERHFGSPQDIEWAIARHRDLPESLFVVQSRPVTGLPERVAAPRAGSAMAMVMGMFGAGRQATDG